MSISDLDSVLKQAEKGVGKFLETSKEAGRIDEQLYNDALTNTIPNLEKWLRDDEIDRISSKLKKGIVDSIQQKDWEQIVNAFRQGLRFGTGGIRGLMGQNKASIVKLKEEGLNTDILKGPNTMNDLVILLTSAGVAKFGRNQPQPLEKVVIGYDSRVRGQDFAASEAMCQVVPFSYLAEYRDRIFLLPNEDSALRS